MIKKLAEEGITVKPFDEESAKLLESAEEKEIVKLLANLPSVINDSARNYDPAKVTKYAIDLATLFHKFYNSCRIKGEQEALMQARLSLSLAVKQVIANILDMLKITCPESM